MKRPVQQRIRLSKPDDEVEVKVGKLTITIDAKDLQAALDPVIEERVRRALIRQRDHRVLRTIYGAP